MVVPGNGGARKWWCPRMVVPENFMVPENGPDCGAREYGARNSVPGSVFWWCPKQCARESYLEVNFDGARNSVPENMYKAIQRKKCSGTILWALPTTP